jgi:TIR domain
MSDDAFLSEADWRNLLREIHDRQVIPIVGPELITVPDAATGAPVSLYRSLAPRLAKALGLEISGTPPGWLNRVACDYLLAGGARKAIYREVSELLDDLVRTVPEPPAALCDLASITDFDLFLTGAIDPLLALALEKVRPGFDRRDHVRAYDYKRPVDLPESLRPALVYHLVGNRQTYPNFAVWEEDYLEFICGLIRHDAQLERLFLLLKTRYLLFLGTPFTDWIVRFFLFVVKGGRFTDHRHDDVSAYLTDHAENLGEPLIFFFDKVVGTTRIIRGDPTAFTCELARRWRAEYENAGADDVLAQMPDEMPRGAVFVSYSRDDHDAVTQLVRGLRGAQIPVWVDKQRLQAGENYERSLEFTVKNVCSFFVSVISRATESDPTRFVHRERRWAAQRHVEGFVFYIPVIIDDTAQPAMEPEEFAKIHFDCLTGGAVTPAFATRLRRLVEEYRLAGQPRA